MMRFLFTLLLMLCAAPASAGLYPADWAADRLQQGLSAYDAGRFHEARKHFALLADHGSAVAETMLGVMYARGRGVKADPATAAAYFYRAANRGYPPAQLALADALARGQGVKADSEAAYFWTRLAQQRGDARIASRARNYAQRLAAALTKPTLEEIERSLIGWRPWAGPTR